MEKITNIDLYGSPFTFKKRKVSKTKHDMLTRAENHGTGEMQKGYPLKKKISKSNHSSRYIFEYKMQTRLGTTRA